MSTVGPDAVARATAAEADARDLAAEIIRDTLDDHRVAATSPDGDLTTCRCGVQWDTPDWRKHVGEVAVAYILDEEPDLPASLAAQPPQDGPQPDEREALAEVLAAADWPDLTWRQIVAGSTPDRFRERADAVLAAGFRRDPDAGLREVGTEYGLRDNEGTIYTGEDEGLRWTREQAEYARDVGGDGVTEDTVLVREVAVHREHVGEWSALAEPTPGSES